MVTKTKSNTTASSLTYADATAKRLAAEEHLATARGAAEAARSARADARRRLSEGDATVTAAELAAVDSDVERTELLAQGAAAALRAAKATEAPLASAHLAELLAPVVDPQHLDDAKAEAVEAVAAALGRLTALAESQRETVRGATKLAQEIGMTGDHAVRLMPQVLAPPVLSMNGRRVVPADVSTLLSDVLNAGAAATGWQLEVRNLQPSKTWEPERDYIAPGPRSWEAFAIEMKRREGSRGRA